ncbi:hypothetical protein ACFPRL_34285 [Pseudoclavibacter helvolus]
MPIPQAKRERVRPRLRSGVGAGGSLACGLVAKMLALAAAARALWSSVSVVKEAASRSRSWRKVSSLTFMPGAPSVSKGCVVWARRGVAGVLLGRGGGGLGSSVG